MLEIWAVFFCCGGAVGGGGRGLNSFCQLELFEKRLYCDPMLNVQAAAAPTQICAALEDAAAQAGEAIWVMGHLLLHLLLLLLSLILLPFQKKFI